MDQPTRDDATPDTASEPRNESAVGRSARLLRFATKYRHLFGAAEPTAEQDAAADELAQDIQQLGPAFIKIGQALSVRPDLLPPRYLEALGALQDDVDRVPFEQVRERIECELGVRTTQAFAELDPEPLAAASLAQVHTALLRDGRQVVVKVQRPNIEQEIRTDLSVLRGAASAADRLTEQGRRVHFAEWIDEISETLAEELDYRLEAENLRVFRSHLTDYPNLVVPAPIDDFSSAKVLTMERIAGHKVSQAVELRRLEEPLDVLARDLMRAYLDQIFLHGLVHADPHPGNVLLMEDGRLGLVDLGMVVRLGPRIQGDLLRLLAAVAHGDGDEAADQVAKTSERLEMFDQRSWNRRCARLVSRFHCSGGLGPSSLGTLMIELTRLSAQCGLRPPAEIAVLGRTLLSLEGVVKVLDPRAEPRELVREHLETVIARRAAGQLNLRTLRERVGEVAELGRELPNQLRDVLTLLAENRFRVRVSGLEESKLLENLQKIANRITAGLISAALVVGAALALKIDAGPKLFGYPGVALVMFVLAFVLSTALVVSSLLSDRRMSRYQVRQR
jgi:ubiquinone biosynthesis protein